MHRRTVAVRPSQMFDTFLDDFFNSPIYSGKYEGVSIDMYEEDGNVVVEAKVPGFKEDDIDMTIEDNVLTITGNTEEEREEENKKKKYYYKELTKQAFTRSVSLPARVSAEQAEAEVKDGMIKIVMPKAPEAMPKKISVKKKA